jgi:hypothetical protein
MKNYHFAITPCGDYQKIEFWNFDSFGGKINKYVRYVK